MSHLTLKLHTGVYSFSKKEAKKYLASEPDFNSDNIAKWILCSILKRTGKLGKNARAEVLEIIKNGNPKIIDCAL